MANLYSDITLELTGPELIIILAALSEYATKHGDPEANDLNISLGAQIGLWEEDSFDKDE